MCQIHLLHRVSNRIGWVNTKTPEKTRMELQMILEIEDWIPINPLLVGFGQTICKSKNPDCDNCLMKSRCNHYKLKSKHKLILL